MEYSVNKLLYDAYKSRTDLSSFGSPLNNKDYTINFSKFSTYDFKTLKGNKNIIIKAKDDSKILTGEKNIYVDYFDIKVFNKKNTRLKAGRKGKNWYIDRINYSFRNDESELKPKYKKDYEISSTNNDKNIDTFIKDETITVKAINSEKSNLKGSFNIYVYGYEIDHPESLFLNNIQIFKTKKYESDDYYRECFYNSTFIKKTLLEENKDYKLTFEREEYSIPDSKIGLKKLLNIKATSIKESKILIGEKTIALKLNWY
ncbi:hypothetical protein [Spiroplasma gladiatoris]|nr:hypothetical protein [Spiroplasma gladiatoris]